MGRDFAALHYNFVKKRSRDEDCETHGSGGGFFLTDTTDGEEVLDEESLDEESLDEESVDESESVDSSESEETSTGLSLFASRATRNLFSKTFKFHKNTDAPGDSVSAFLFLLLTPGLPLITIKSVSLITPVDASSSSSSKPSSSNVNSPGLILASLSTWTVLHRDVLRS